MPTPTIIPTDGRLRQVCDGWDVDVDGVVLHFTSEPTEADVAAALAAPAPEPVPETAPDVGALLRVAQIVDGINTSAAKAVIIAEVKEAQAITRGVV